MLQKGLLENPYSPIDSATPTKAPREVMGVLLGVPVRGWLGFGELFQWFRFRFGLHRVPRSGEAFTWLWVQTHVTVARFSLAG